MRKVSFGLLVLIMALAIPMISCDESSEPPPPPPRATDTPIVADTPIAAPSPTP